VRIGDRDVTSLAPHRRARIGLARTFQRLELFGLLSVADNVRLAADVAGVGHADELAGTLLARVGLDGVRDTRADQLPTGQARRVEQARALATRPSVLLLDEPASGQDEQETAGFAEIVREVAASGVAVVLVEHDVSLVMAVCDTIHVLDFGRIIASGSPSEIQHDDGVRRAYLGAMGVDA
jgi:branched-chain amino acid transport system ATP-binding protein